MKNGEKKDPKHLLQMKFKLGLPNVRLHLMIRAMRPCQAVALKHHIRPIDEVLAELKKKPTPRCFALAKNGAGTAYVRIRDVIGSLLSSNNPILQARLREGYKRLETLRLVLTIDGLQVTQSQNMVVATLQIPILGSIRHSTASMPVLYAGLGKESPEAIITIFNAITDGLGDAPVRFKCCGSGCFLCGGVGTTVEHVVSITLTLTFDYKALHCLTNSNTCCCAYCLQPVYLTSYRQLFAAQRSVQC